MVSFENFVKSMPPSLSELKVVPSSCFAFKTPDNVTATNLFIYLLLTYKIYSPTLTIQSYYAKKKSDMKYSICKLKHHFS